MKYSESKGVNCPPMSLSKKQIPSQSDGTAPFSFSKKAAMGGESRPADYRPETKFGKNK